MYTTHHLSVRVLLGVGTALAVALAATPAVARPIEREQVSFEDTFVDEDFCGSGLAVQIDFALESSFLLNTRGAAKTAHFLGADHFTETFTNLATGASITHIAHVLFQDLDIVDNGDGTLTITQMGAGSDKFFGPDGKLVYNDPGQTRWQFVVEHNDTLDFPFDDTFVEDFGVVFGSTGRNDIEDAGGFCPAMLAVIG